jgi:clan AA aspartic protease
MATQRSGIIRKNALNQEQRVELARKAAALRWGPRKGEVGLFAVTIEVAHPIERQFIMVEAVVDTGASHTILPTSLLEELGIRPIDEVTVGFGNGDESVCRLGEARVAHDGQERTCIVIFGVDDVYLLGATTLELFNLAVDPVRQELVPSRVRG